MWVLGDISQPTLLGFAAIATSISGILSTWYGFHKSNQETRRQEQEECHKKLMEARKEGEDVAEELHQLKMKLAKQ